MPPKSETAPGASYILLNPPAAVQFEIADDSTAEVRKMSRANPSPDGRRWPEGPDEGYHKYFFNVFSLLPPSPAASRHPLPSREGFVCSHTRGHSAAKPNSRVKPANKIVSR